MASMQALLKIKATTEGEGAITSMARGLGGLKQGAERASGGLKGLLTSAGGLSGALGSLVPLVSGVGLVAMGKSAIDAADDMNDLAQKTGVSVEQLSRFQQAANSSGTSIDAVGGAMVKLNRNLATRNDQAIGALTSLGLSATDASGKLKTTDQIMLEVSEKFRTMPDGAQKTTLAMQLFGRSGADMIPLLNGGRQAIESLDATMTGKFAKGADELNDKMATLQGKLLEFGVSIGTALMPVLNLVADAVVAAAAGFQRLPEPVQTTIAVVGGLLALLLALAPAISAIISIGSAIAGLFAAGGVLASAGSIIAGIATAFIVLITGPLGIVALLVAAGVAIYAFRDQIGAAFNAVVNFIGGAFNKIGDLLKAGAQAYMDYYVRPILGFFKGLYDGAVAIFKNIGSAIGGAFQTVVATIKNVFRSVLQYLADRVNFAAGLINVLIKAFNKLPAPDIPLVPTLSVPAFAQGGTVNRPTLAMVGEGGQREYIIPESKMAAASSSFLAGARGDAVLAGSGGKSPVINITTGPVMEFDGQRYVTVTDMERAMRLTAEGVIGRLRTPSARIALGMA